MSLITACAIFCSLCCLYMYFLWRHHLPLDKSENEDSGSDWFTYCVDIWLLTLLFSLRYLSESCFGNDNKFLLPNPWVVLFFIYPTFYSLKILFTQHFLFGATPPPSIWRLSLGEYDANVTNATYHQASLNGRKSMRVFARSWWKFALFLWRIVVYISFLYLWIWMVFNGMCVAVA
jgi:hypothetical protein